MKPVSEDEKEIEDELLAKQFVHFIFVLKYYFELNKSSFMKKFWAKIKKICAKKTRKASRKKIRSLERHFCFKFTYI